MPPKRTFARADKFISSRPFCNSPEDVKSLDSVALIGEVVPMPGKKRGAVHAELRGKLFGIRAFVKGKENQRVAECMPAVVASP
jgi:hypothetical protein